jgi:hypothetical protein
MVRNPCFDAEADGMVGVHGFNGLCPLWMRWRDSHREVLEDDFDTERRLPLVALLC